MPIALLTPRRVSRIIVALAAIGGVVTAPGTVDAQTPPDEPSAIIGVEWMRTVDNGASAPWMSTLSVVVTSPEGADVSDRCTFVDAIEQSGFRRVQFDCFDLADGTYDVELVGVPDEETPTSTCTSVSVPTPQPDDGTNCLWSFFSPGVAPTTTTTTTPSTTTAPPSTTDPSVGAELPSTGHSERGSVLIAVLLVMGGLALLGAARRPLGG